jgi:hypothetical protein
MRSDMMNKTIKTNLNKLTKNFILNITFHISKEFKVRLWIATKLIQLASKILGCTFSINREYNEEK